MEEIEDYFRGEGIELQRYEYWEEEIQENENGNWISVLKTEDILHNDAIHLIETTDDGILVINSLQYPEIPNFCIFRSWEINKTLPGIDDKGWLYSHFTSKRKRMWEQLLVNEAQYHQCNQLIPHLHSKFRGFNLSFLRRALHPIEYHTQMVLECQRLSNGVYSPYNLLHTDPPAWARSPVNTACPCDLPSNILLPFNQESFRIPVGWTCLHDFIFVTYPTRDIAGWQYAPAFDSVSYSTSAFLPSKEELGEDSHEVKNELYSVRRRMWIRTLVRQEDLQYCRDLLSNYIKSHPRGHILATKLYRQSHYRKRWCFGMGLLIDREIHVLLDHNYQNHVVYPLEGCEVSVLSLKYRHPSGVTESNLNFIPSFKNHNKPHKFYLFGLRYILGNKTTQDTKGIEGSMQCIFTTLTNKDRDLWISALYHQLMLVNQHNHPPPTIYSVKLGPHVPDSSSLSGKLWRKIDEKWKCNYVELKEGRITCYEDGIVLEELFLQNCHICIPDDVNYQYPFLISNNTTDDVLYLSAKTPQIRQSWLHMIQQHIDSFTRNIGSGSESESLTSTRWFDYSDMIDDPPPTSTTTGSSPYEYHEDNLFQHSVETLSSSSLATAAGGLSSSNPFFQYFRDILSSNIVIEPVINMRIETYNTIRESNQLSDYENEEEFYSEFNREESDDTIHSLGKLMYTELVSNRK